MQQRARVAAAVLALCGLAAGAAALGCGEAVPAGGTPGLAQPAGPGLSSSSSPEVDDAEAEQADNGQTGSLSPSECGADIDCIPVLEQWQGGDEQYELLASACEHGSSNLRPFRALLPTCVCNLSVTRTTGSRGVVSRETQETQILLQHDERLSIYTGLPECLVSGGVPGACSYCDHEFAGCDVGGEGDECAAQCADAVERLRAAERVQHDVELRAARCSESGHCQVALRIDDTCYNRDLVPSSCALSDEQIMAAESEAPNPAQQCQRPPPACESAEDCPAGLACNGSVCGACLGVDDPCLASATGACQNGDFVCGSGEACLAGVCVLSAGAECVSQQDCPTTDVERDPRACLLNRLDYLDGRGNERTQTFCSSLHPNSFGLRMGDVLELRVLGPADAVASQFEPPLSRPTGPCGEGTGFEPGTVRRLRIEALSSGTSYDSYADPRGVLIDASAPVESMPAPVHERDPATGRMLWSSLSTPMSYASLATLATDEPSMLQGCPGRRTVWLGSLLEPAAPGAPRRLDGTFPTTILSYQFRTEGDPTLDPACAPFPEFGCTERLHVEVTRLTP